jgi:hypothetical protein
VTLGGAKHTSESRRRLFIALVAHCMFHKIRKTVWSLWYVACWDLREGGGAYWTGLVLGRPGGGSEQRALERDRK